MNIASLMSCRSERRNVVRQFNFATYIMPKRDKQSDGIQDIYWVHAVRSLMPHSGWKRPGVCFSNVQDEVVST